ncbi:kinesin-like protein KIF22 [Protopterus annectens]|uniref:kinesin-like protein KIF22 n=1 Tax=Protopterus annectens TaxID=7888 RepID=UPI001CFB26CD|nr:kinesin-like protein KIF22 [Protopterus annectens]
MALRVSASEVNLHSRKPQSARVRVAVRLRPYAKQDDEKQQGPCVRGIDAQSLEIINWRNQTETVCYQFDKFYGEKASQLDVYKGSVLPILGHILNGQNASVFAYGPTGAGKTHTMLGSPEQPGVIPRALRDIFQMTRELRSQAEHENWDFTITMSYLEIYQEKVLDLLEPKQQDLPIREDMNKNIFIPNLTQKVIASFAEFEKQFIPASQNRTVASTKLNSRSSRSHSVLLLKVVKKERVSPFRQLTGKLYLIDLAGSEDNRRTGNQGIRLKESGAINSSLFVLSKVVDALNQGLPRIPYRDSKLTRLLQDSLGGTAHSVVVTNISPEHKYYFDTLSALNFAAKSKQVVNKPFTQETIQSMGKVPMKRTHERQDSEDCEQAKKSRIEEGEETPPKPKVARSPLPNIENLDPGVVQRLLRLDSLMRNDANGMPQLDTPKRERLALLKVVEESQNEIMQLKERQKELEERVRVQNTSQTSSDETPNTSLEIKASRLPLPHRSCTANVRKQAVVLPMKTRSPLTAVMEGNFFTMQNKCKDTSVTEENKEEWELKINDDLLKQHRSNILSLLNTGSLKELKTLQKIGDKKAQLILGWREVNGPFMQIEDLQKVDGISAKQMASFLKANILGSIGR